MYNRTGRFPSANVNSERERGRGRWSSITGAGNFRISPAQPSLIFPDQPFSFIFFADSLISVTGPFSSSNTRWTLRRGGEKGEGGRNYYLNAPLVHVYTLLYAFVRSSLSRCYAYVAGECIMKQYAKYTEVKNKKKKKNRKKYIQVFPRGKTVSHGRSNKARKLRSRINLLFSLPGKNFNYDSYRFSSVYFSISPRPPFARIKYIHPPPRIYKRSILV